MFHAHRKRLITPLTKQRQIIDIERATLTQRHRAFWVSRQHGQRLFYSSSLICTLANRNVFLRQITAGCKHNSAQLDKWLEILARGRFNTERTVT